MRLIPAFVVPNIPFEAKAPYIRMMAIFPRPASPRSAFGDLWNYIVQSRAHKWPLLGVSAAFTWLIVWAFLVDSNTNAMPRQNKITYFQSWDANRSDAAIILQQKLDLAQAEAAMRKKQLEMRKVADQFGIEWRAEAKVNEARHAKALKRVEDALDARLAKAEAEEATDKTAVKKSVVASPTAIRTSSR